MSEPTTPEADIGTPMSDHQEQDSSSILNYFADPFEEFFDVSGETFDADAEALSEDEFDWEQLDLKGLLPDAPQLQKLLKSRLKEVLTPKRIMLRDKISYVLGSLHLLVSAYWLGSSPSTFHILYTVKAFVLLSIRWATYKMQRSHYYLFDFCYLVQVLLLMQIWFFPESVTFIKVVFAFSHGPLLWSILAFRNSLVFHSLDRVTSLFLHFFPALVCWAARWYPSQQLQAALEASPDLRSRWEHAGFRDLCLLPLLPYIIWAVAYYIKIFIISSNKIQQRNYETLFRYVTSRRTGLFAIIVLKFPPKFQPVVYMLMHLALTTLAMVFNVWWWSHKDMGMAFIVFAFAWSAWNGANYYFEIFAHRYVSSLGITPRQAHKRDDTKSE